MRSSITASALLLVLVAVAGASDVPFADRTTLSTTANGATAVATGDIDADGDLDLVVATSLDSTSLSWWENRFGDGSSWLEHTINSGYGTSFLTTADVDSDGDLDVVGTAEDFNGLIWWENNRNLPSDWTSHAVSSSLSGASSVAAGDIDSDGDLDLATTAAAADRVSWYEQTAAGTWQGRIVDSAAYGARQVQIADFDSDGDLDLAATAEDGDQVFFYASDGTPGDGGWVRNEASWNLAGAAGIAAGDADGDGDLDLFVTAAADNHVLWLENDGSPSVGGWVQHLMTDYLVGARAVAVQDLDLDGDLDAVVSGSGGFAWYERLGGFHEHTLDAGLAGGNLLAVADLDTDGDADVVGTSPSVDTLAWWQNQTIHRNALFPAAETVDPAFSGTRGLTLFDLDGNGTLDILGAAYDGDDITVWYTSVSGSSVSWSASPVSSSFNGASDVTAADLDSDGDLDVVGVASLADQVLWWESDGGTVPAWTQRTVATLFDGATGVCVSDLDSDGDLDVAATAYVDDTLTWWANDGSPGNGGWVRNDVATSLDGPGSLACADLTADGHSDLVVAASAADTLTLFVNSGAGSFAAAPVAVAFDSPLDLDVADVDSDGDLDVVAPTYGGDGVAWFESSGGSAPSFTRHDLGTVLDGASSVAAVDLDDDGDVDVVAGGINADALAVWLNESHAAAWQGASVGAFDQVRELIVGDLDRDGQVDIVVGDDGAADDVLALLGAGGQYGWSGIDRAPRWVGDAELFAVWRLDLEHSGREGDPEIELSLVELGFHDETGAALTSVEANALLDELRLYRDDGDGAFEPASDTLVYTLTDFTLSGMGSESMTFDHLAAGVQVTGGAVQPFHVALLSTANGSSQAQRSFTVTISQVDARDRDHDLALLLPFDVAVTGGLVTVDQLLFADGFESGNASAWSAAVP